MSLGNNNPTAEELRERVRRSAEVLKSIKAPNREIPGLDVENVRNIASRLLAADSDFAEIGTEVQNLPDIEIDYESDEMEIIVIRSKLNDIKFSFIHWQSVSEFDSGLASAKITPDIHDQLSKLALSLAETRADIHNIKTGIERRSGVSVSVAGIVSIEAESIKRTIDEVIPAARKHASTNLDRLNQLVEIAKRRVLDLANYVESVAEEVGLSIVRLARAASLKVNEAFVSSLTALKLFLEQQVNSRVQSQAAPRPSSARPKPTVVKDENDIVAWLKLNAALDAFCLSKNVTADNLDQKVAAVEAALGDGVAKRIGFVLARLRESMQQEKHGVSAYVIEVERLTKILTG